MKLKKSSVESDPRGLIFEAYRIEGISVEECRSIFLDWVMGLQSDYDVMKEIKRMISIYANHNPNHPMNKVLEESNQRPKPRRSRRTKAKL